MDRGRQAPKSSHAVKKGGDADPMRIGNTRLPSTAHIPITPNAIPAMSAPLNSGMLNMVLSIGSMYIWLLIAVQHMNKIRAMIDPNVI